MSLHCTKVTLLSADTYRSPDITSPCCYPIHRIPTSMHDDNTMTYTWLTALPELPTVEEDVGIEEEPPQEATAAEPTPAAETYHERSASVLSGFSGTSAMTSFSQEQIGELDADIMVDILPILAAAADDLAKLLVPADPKTAPIIRKEVRHDGSRSSKRYHNRVKSLELHKRGFGETSYIQPSIALRALLGVQNVEDITQGPWRPDNVIYKINLSTMLRAVCVEVSGHEVNQNEYAALEDLDNSFGSAIAGPVFSEAAFQFCLSLLRQLAIVRLSVYRPDPSYNPRQHILQAFYQDGELAFRHQNSLHVLDLPREQATEYTNILQNVANELIELFDEHDSSEWDGTIGEIKAFYPWEKFVDQTVEYFLFRRAELDENIAAVGGLDHITASLTGEVERRAAEKEAQSKRESFARPNAIPRKSIPKSGIKAAHTMLRNLQKEKLQNSAAAAYEAPPTAAPVAQMTDPALTGEAPRTNNDLQQSHADEQNAPASEPNPPHSHFRAITSFQAHQQRETAKGKGPSLLDRQAGAERIGFNEPGSTQLTGYAAPPTFPYPDAPASGQQPYYTSPGRASNKRPHAAVESDEPDVFEPTQDGDFQTDDRDTAAADERRRRAPQPTRPQQPRQSYVASSALAPSGTAGPMHGSPRAAKVPRRNPGSSIPDPTLAADPDDYQPIRRDTDFEIAKIAARHNTVRATQMKPQKTRNPWSTEEDNALIDLIAAHGEDGISYSALKKFDDHRADREPVLWQRSPEDMRFKARNMKEVFLK